MNITTEITPQAKYKPNVTTLQKVKLYEVKLDWFSKIICYIFKWNRQREKIEAYLL